MTPVALPNPRPSFLTLLLQVGGQLGGIVGFAALLGAVGAWGVIGATLLSSPVSH